MHLEKSNEHINSYPTMGKSKEIYDKKLQISTSYVLSD